MTAVTLDIIDTAPDGSPLPVAMLAEKIGPPFAGLELTCLTCGRHVRFVDATAQRVQWYTTSHRCGPPEGRWQT